MHIILYDQITLQNCHLNNNSFMAVAWCFVFHQRICRWLINISNMEMCSCVVSPIKSSHIFNIYDRISLTVTSSRFRSHFSHFAICLFPLWSQQCSYFPCHSHTNKHQQGKRTHIPKSYVYRNWQGVKCSCL